MKSIKYNNIHEAEVENKIYNIINNILKKEKKIKVNDELYHVITYHCISNIRNCKEFIPFNRDGEEKIIDIIRKTINEIIDNK